MKYWLWLANLPTLNARKRNDLLYRFGTPENLFFADEQELVGPEGLTSAERRDIMSHDLSTAELILEQCESKGIRLLTQQDALYPERLKNIFDPPCVLYYKGKLPSLDEEAALCVVGSRSASPYGQQAASRLAYGLARAGVVIVSGLARGIDACAHIAALQAGAFTVAVLGCGVDVVYPADNTKLYHDIAATGLLLSEYPPGTRAIGSHFPVRNRLLSGLSLGTLVVEAPAHSGSLITARYALEQGRDVFAVPGNIDSPESRGANALIQAGAQLVCEPSDILKEYAALYPQKIIERNFAPQDIVTYPGARDEPSGLLTVADNQKVPVASKKTKAAVTPAPKPIDLSPLLERFSEAGQAVLVSLVGAPKNADEIARAVSLPISRVLRELTMLELEGILTALPGGRYSLSLEEDQ